MIYLILFTFIVFVILFFSNYHFTLEVFPHNETLFEYGAYSDDHTFYNDTVSLNDSNSSFVNVRSEDNQIRFTYKLNSKSKHPHATLLYHARELNRLVNLTKYKYLSIDIDSDHSDEFLLTMYLYVPGYTKINDLCTHRPYSYLFSGNIKSGKYIIPISDFVTPIWWYEINGVSEEDLPETDWTKSTHLGISNCINTEQDKIKHVTINGIFLLDSIFLKLLKVLIISGIFFIVGLIFVNVLLKNRQIPSFYTNNKEEGLYSKVEQEILISFIGENFQDPLLTLSIVEKKLEINRFKINQILKDKYSMPFKQYLTSVRLQEAKRLLIDTGYPIFEVANKVGYCYSNSFIRVFKNIEGITPIQYREKNSS